MRAGTKFGIGALVIVAGVAGLIATGVQETGVYFLTPTELMARTRADSTFHDVGIKVGEIGHDPGIIAGATSGHSTWRNSSRLRRISAAWPLPLTA